MSDSIFVDTKVWPPYERPGETELNRDFYHPQVGYGTLSELIAPYDSNHKMWRVASFSVVLISFDPPLPTDVETLPSPFDLLVLTDEEMSKTIIEQGINKIRERNK